MNELTGRHLQEYHLRGKENGDPVLIPPNRQMYTARAFVEWYGYVDAVPRNARSISPSQRGLVLVLPTVL